MATALAAGASAAGLVQPNQLVFANPGADKQRQLAERFPGCRTVSAADQMLADCYRIILAVKPPVLRAIAGDLSRVVDQRHLLVSIAAGISLADLESMLGTKRIVRVMPNTPCQVGAGSSAVSALPGSAEEDVAWVESLMRSVGRVQRLPDHLMHAFTGIAGSSPAYIYLVIEALSDGGVAQGLSRSLATEMAAQAVLGAAKMVLETGLHPGQLKDQVTSPGGTTIAALGVLEAAAVRSAFAEAVAACTAKSQELGE